MKKLFTIFTILIGVLSIFAQNLPPIFEENNAVIVIEDGDTLKYPFFGGLDNPQFNDIDLNNNGIKDLVIFDKANNRVYTFLNLGIANEVSYSYNKFYEQFFPDDIDEWLQLVDYNNDGIEDIFTYTNSGFKVYKAFYQTGNIAFTLVQEKLFYTSNSGNPINVYCSSVDVPGIADVNGDGDLDILNFGVLGSTLVYYENQSIENGYDYDSLYFEAVTTCWGNFSENSSNSGISLNTFCQPTLQTPQNSETLNLHAGSSILAFDYDFDDDIDILLGDVSSKNITLLINGGNNLNAHIDTFINNFPNNTLPISVFTFPAIFLLDVNNDGLEDLISAPNATIFFENIDQVNYHKGIFNTNNYAFEFVQKDFLVNEMIDVGSVSTPIIIDFDGDGKKDILIGNYVYSDTSAYDGIFNNTLTAYKNIGDSSNLVFELYDRDFNNLSQHFLQGIYPVFEDFDFDGDKDMITLNINGRLNYFKNSAGTGNLINLSLSSTNLNNINIGTSSQPFTCIYNYNNDSLPDLIIGERSANLNLLENISVGSSVGFQEITNFFGAVDVAVSPSISGYAAPFVAKLDSTHKDFLIVHNLNGTLNLFKDFNQTSATKLDTFYSNFNSGGRGGIFVDDINGDNFQDLLIGNKRGGLNFLTQTEQYFPIPIDTNIIDTMNVDTMNVDTTDSFTNIINYFEENFQMQISPNPTEKNEILNIYFNKIVNSNLQIYNSFGKLVFNKKIDNQTQFSLQNLNLKSGLFFVQVKYKNKNHTKKLLVY